MQTIYIGSVLMEGITKFLTVCHLLENKTFCFCCFVQGVFKNYFWNLETT